MFDESFSVEFQYEALYSVVMAVGTVETDTIVLDTELDDTFEELDVEVFSNEAVWNKHVVVTVRTTSQIG